MILKTLLLKYDPANQQFRYRLEIWFALYADVALRERYVNKIEYKVMAPGP